MSKKKLKHVEIADWLRENIYNSTFKAGEKLISEHSLCEKFNVSRHTARLATAALEKEGLVARRKGSGTYINGNSHSKRKNVGVLLTFADDYTFPDMIFGIEEVLSNKGHRISFGLTHNKVENERNQLVSLLAANVDGLIVEAVKSALANPNLDIYSDFAARNIPVLFVNTYYPRLDCSYIVNNDVEGSRIATEFLIKQGHRKVGGIFKHDAIQGGLRYEGFVNKLYEQNLKLDENRVIWYSEETLDNLFSDEQLPLLAKTLSDCTAVLCYSDRVGYKLIEASQKLGINIPNDLSIASFDNSFFSKLVRPSITTVTHPGVEMGRLAAESLSKIIDNPGKKIQHTYQPSLVIRDSVKKILH